MQRAGGFFPTGRRNYDSDRLGVRTGGDGAGFDALAVRQAMAGFLAGYGDSTREAYSLDLRQWIARAPLMISGSSR